MSRLRQRFARAVAKGELPGSVDADGLGTYFATVQHGMSILARDGADYATLQAVARHAVDSLSALVSSHRLGDGGHRQQA